MQKNIFSLAICLILIAGFVGAVQATDVKLKKRARTGSSLPGKTNSLTGGETVVYTKDGQARIETEIGAASKAKTEKRINTVIVQPEQKREIRFNNLQKTFSIAPAAGAENVVNASNQGGLLAVTGSITDTGEKTEIFGYLTHHFKQSLTFTPNASACQKTPVQVEVDGWYAFSPDFAPLYDEFKKLPSLDQLGGNCQDAISWQVKGINTVGFALKEVKTIKTNGQTLTLTEETIEINKTPVDAALFAPPKDYQPDREAAAAKVNPATAQKQPAAIQPVAPVATAGKAEESRDSKSDKKGGFFKSLKSTVSSTTKPATESNNQQPVSTATAHPAPNTPAAATPNSAAAPSKPVATVATAMSLEQRPVEAKKPGVIRIGIARPKTQLASKSDSFDEALPIRNTFAGQLTAAKIEPVAIESSDATQFEAEALAKQCDYFLTAKVTQKKGGMMGNIAPVLQVASTVGMFAGLPGMIAAGVISVAASGIAKSTKAKDKMIVEYQLFKLGTTTPFSTNKFESKANSDGEDVLTPLLEQAAKDVSSKAVAVKAN